MITRPAPEEYAWRYDVVARYHVAYHAAKGANPWMDFEPQLRWWTVNEIIGTLDNGARVLDAGCGIGLMLEDLSEVFDVVGVDLAADYVEHAKARGLDARQAWLEELPFADDEFDAAVCCDVFEHVLKPELVLAELRRVVKPGGHIIARVPLGDATNVGATSQFGFPVHLQAWTQDEFAAFLGAEDSYCWKGPGNNDEVLAVAVNR